MKAAPTHLLGIAALSVAEINTLLQRAQGYVGKQAWTKSLENRSIVTLFFENSTRTRATFALAATRLGARVVSIHAEASSTRKGETLLDTARNLAAMGSDALVLRHPASGAPALLARHVPCSILNAGDGAHEHPTQALADALTILQHQPSLQGLVVAICGDVLHSRVARSNIFLLTKMGARVRVVAPPTLLPAAVADLGADLGVEVHHQLAQGVKDADVVMLLRLQTERMAGAFIPSPREYHHFYGVSHASLSPAKPHALVLHPGPVNRGIELSGALADDPQHSRVLQQVACGVAVRMACLEWVLGVGV